MDILKKWAHVFTCFFGLHKFVLKSGRPIPVIIMDPETNESHNATLFIMTCPYCGELRYDFVFKDRRVKAEVM